MTTIWPSDKLEIETTLTIDAIVAGLRPIAHGARPVCSTWPKVRYKGTVDSQGFRLRRPFEWEYDEVWRVWLRHTDGIILEGTLEPGDKTVQVKIRFRRPWWIATFWYAWLGFPATLAILKTWDWLLRGQSSFKAVVFLWVVCAIGWTILSGAFWMVAKDHKCAIRDVFRELEVKQSAE